MNELQLLLLLVFVFVGSFVVVWLVEGTHFYRRYRGKRLIVCPETHKPEAVEIAVGKGAAKAVLSEELRLKNCTRWPERADCGQECLSQIEEAPDGCLVSSIVTHWFEGKSCAVCGSPFAHLEWHNHRPALLSPKGKTVQWNEIPAQTLPDVLATHKPVCWQCHVHESFRREHAELVTDRKH